MDSCIRLYFTQEPSLLSLNTADFYSHFILIKNLEFKYDDIFCLVLQAPQQKKSLASILFCYGISTLC